MQGFLNSHYDLELEHGVDLFATPASLRAWLERRGLIDGSEDRVIGPDQLARAVAVREGLRSLADQQHGDLAALNRAAAGLRLELRFGAGGDPRLIPAPASAVERALAAVLAITARAMIDGRWARLKVCPGHDCGWAFYDHSRNQSGRWCSMAICGGRSKARAHYRRRRGSD